MNYKTLTICTPDSNMDVLPNINNDVVFTIEYGIDNSEKASVTINKDDVTELINTLIYLSDKMKQWTTN